MGIPAAAGIFREQLKHPNLTLSQRIMHSRVYAQASILTILLSTMAFTDFMSRRGGAFKAEDEEEVEVVGEKEKVPQVKVTSPLIEAEKKE